jgi:hypothetical protein
VRLATAEALGQLVGLISKPQLTSALPRLLPAILAVCRKEEEDPLPVTHSLHMVLSAVLIKYSAPLVDFQVDDSSSCDCQNEGHNHMRLITQDLSCD